MEVVVIEKEAFLYLTKRIKNLESRYALLKDELIKDRLYTSKEVQRILGVGRDTMQRYRDSGKLKFIKTGKTIRYRWADIQNLLLA